MKRARYILLLLLLFNSVVYAQDDVGNRPQLLFSGGLSQPFGPEDLTEYWNAGFNLGVGLDIYASYSWDLSLSLDYSRFPVDEPKYRLLKGFNDRIDILGASTSIMAINISVKYYLIEDASVIPYLIVGIGSMKYSIDQMEAYNANTSISTEFSVNSFHFGTSTGVGFEYPVGSKFSVFSELKYQHGFAANRVSILPVQFGVKLK